MKKIVVLIVLATLVLQTGFLSGVSAHAQGEVTPTPTESPTPTGTPEPTATDAPTATEPPTATETPVATETPIPTPTETVVPTPTPGAIVGEVALTLSASPNVIRRGKDLSVDWSVSGFAGIPTNALLRFQLPDGVTATDPKSGTWNRKERIFDLPLSDVTGSVAFKVGTKTQSPLIINVDLLQDGTILASAEISLLEPDETRVEQKGGKVRGLKDSVEVTFPDGALLEVVKVTVGKPSKESLPKKSLSGSAFELTALSETTGEEVSQFQEPVEIQLHYSEAGMTSEEDLRLFWYDEADGFWKQVVNQQVDIENNLLIAYVDHFTVFDSYNSNWQTAETPTLDAFQHSGFTGAASFSMPIKVPAGPGGFQPSLTLSYSSSTVDNVSSDSQASWAGMGWSLSPSYIERNGHGTNSTLDDSFSVNLNGMSMEIMKGADGKYHAADENFYKMEYDLPVPGGETASTWTIWDKSGNKYVFDTRTEFVESKSCTGYPDRVDFNTYVWRWSLTKTVNIYGKEMNYAYANDTKTLQYPGCGGGISNKTVNTYTYPSTITYANGRYQILFTRIGRTDYKDLWASPYNYSYMAYQQSLLRTIQIKQDADGNGDFETIIRKYVFNYATAPDTIFPDLEWEAGGLTPTLLSVREYGLGGTGTPLPGYTFTYGDDMHLTSATNGYGGTASYTYETWNESLPYQSWGNGVADGYIPAWGNPSMYKFTDWAEGWVAAGAYPNTVTHNPGGTGSITVTGLARNPNTGNGAFSFQPGRWYLIVASAKKTSGTGNQMRLGVRYQQGSGAYQTLYGGYTALTTNYKTISSGLIYLPVNATSFEPRIDSQPSPGGSNTVDWIAVYPMPTANRVTARTLATGAASYTFSYDYVNAATNNPTISTEAGGAHPYSRPYTEFRGHYQVIETDPYGKKTTTTYYQDDCTSGRANTVTVRDANNKLMQQTQTTYDCTSTNSTILLKDKDTRNPALYDTYFDPIQYRWVRTATESKEVYGGTPNGVVATLTTTYNAYDAYGNLTQKTVSGTDVETLVTNTQYFPNVSGGRWLVGLPGRTYVQNGAGTTLSSSINLYDGANTYNTAPTTGVLTATRQLISGSNYSQTSLTRDAWGNVTSQTVWTGYGTASTAPTAGAQTSYTCYGTGGTIGGTACANDGYYTYALWTKNAKGHKSTVTYDYAKGLPLTETDPNNAVTTATYDNFGRFTSLAKPGDASPSLNVSYVNYPFKVTLTQAIDTGLTFTVVRNYDGMGRQTSTVTNGVTTVSTFNAYGKPITQSMPHTTGAWYYTTTEYDSMGRAISITAPDGSVTTSAFNGLTSSVTDDKNHTHTTVTDILGRTLSVTPPTGPAVTFDYDAVGNMLTATRGGAEMTLTYDKAGRKLTMDDPDMGDWSYAYNALGGMTRQEDAKDQVTCLYYDELNRPRGKDYFTNSAACPTDPGSGYDVGYGYDAGTNGKGRRTSMSITGADFTQWTYDPRGRVLSENKQITGGGQFVTAFTYNTADLPITMTYPDGEVVEFEYNNNMLPVSVSGTNVYAQTIAYDSANRMIQLIRGANRINTVFTYNNWNVDSGRLQNLTSTQVSTGTQLQNSTYDYDSVGNIETIVDSLSGPQTQTFQYDALDRLTNSSVTGGTDGLYTEGYTYNGTTGNLASKNSATYTYSATHKHAVSSLSNGNTYGYDANGNMTSRHVFEGTEFKDYTLTYNAENQLVSVSGDATASFVYDGDGKQIKATVNGITAVYVGNHYEVKNSIVTKYYFAGATRLAVRTDGTLRFLLGDHLGSSSVTTNASGAKTASALYKAFGETRFTSGTLSTDYKFTGQREESALGGIYFFQSRWFDPTLGRFMSPDTIVPTSTQGTQAWDRYAFVNNNPVRYTDPTGHGIDEDKNDHQQENETEENSQEDNPSNCTENQDGVICQIYIPEEALDAIDELIDGAIWSARIGYALTGVLVGAAVGGGLPGAIIGGVLFSIAGAYDVSILESMRTEIHDSVKNGVPLVVASPMDNKAVGFVVDGGDGSGPLVNTPMAFFTLDLLVTLTTGTSLVP